MSPRLGPVPSSLNLRCRIPGTLTPVDPHWRHHSPLPRHDQFITLANVEPVLIRIRGAGVPRRTVQPDDDAGGPGRRRDEIELQGVELGHGAVGID
jgi:hypothetical protein